MARQNRLTLSAAFFSERMETLKKIWKYLSSMQFAILLLVVLALACALGSFITQGQTFDWYAARYNERIAALILAVQLDDAFHSWWFIAITAFLCLNLLLCNVIRLPQLIRRTKAEGDPHAIIGAAGDVSQSGIADPKAVFSALRMQPKTVSMDGKEALVASQNRIGLWGAWVCHLGILLLILGFGLGQMTKTEYVVYGVPGQTRMIGDTGWFLTIDDFRIGLREDDTVEQYTADITVFRAPQGSTTMPDARRASISVNHPAKLFGMTFYQNSTGWAARMNVAKAGEPLQSEVVCAGEYLTIKDLPELAIYLAAFYPDYALVPGSGPMTLSGQLNNPAYLYSVYYRDELLGMNVLMPDEELTIDDYTVTFCEPQSYTLISIKRDAFAWLAFVGGVVTTVGLFLALYLPPKKVWAIRDEDGTWTVRGASRKGGVIFRDRFLTATGGTERNES